MQFLGKPLQKQLVVFGSCKFGFGYSIADLAPSLHQPTRENSRDRFVTEVLDPLIAGSIRSRLFSGREARKFPVHSTVDWHEPSVRNCARRSMPVIQWYRSVAGDTARSTRRSDASTPLLHRHPFDRCRGDAARPHCRLSRFSLLSRVGNRVKNGLITLGE